VATAADAEVVVQTYWGALEEKVHAHLLDADVDAVGYDFVTDHEQNLYNINEYGTKDDIALGLVDGQNTLVETPAEILERIDWVDDNTTNDFETVYATANTELFYLPDNKFQAKLEALAEAADLEEVEA
jgi:5-methyltetrahydropteroyltriglutamate--homocysteine methyltransferase